MVEESWCNSSHILLTFYIRHFPSHKNNSSNSHIFGKGSRLSFEENGVFWNTIINQMKWNSLTLGTIQYSFQCHYCKVLHPDPPFQDQVLEQSRFHLRREPRYLSSLPPPSALFLLSPLHNRSFVDERLKQKQLSFVQKLIYSTYCNTNVKNFIHPSEIQMEEISVNGYRDHLWRISLRSLSPILTMHDVSPFIGSKQFCKGWGSLLLLAPFHSTQTFIPFRYHVKMV